MAKKEKGVKRNDKAEDSKTYAFLATFLSIIGFIIALVTKKNDKYVMYYAKQSLVIFLIYVIAAVIAIIPAIGSVISTILYLIGAIFWIISWIYALSGEEKRIWLISDFADKFNL